jgi:hypothetical protein
MYNAGYMSNSSFIQVGMVLNTTYSAYYYSQHPDVSLLYFDSNYYSYASYGAGYMFLFYLADKYGIQIIKDLISIDDLDGPEAIEHVLSNHGHNFDFNELFLDFITACTIDQIGIYNDLYGFLNADFQIAVRHHVPIYPKSFTDIDYRYYGIEIFELSETPNKFTLELETPNEPASLGVVIAIKDDNGWNITQSVFTGNGNKTRIYCNGENIQKAYVITSKIRLGITAGPRIWVASPISKLDLSIESGHNNPLETKFEISIISISFVIMCSLILMIRRRKLKYQNNL